ncbi:unnamed protein product [Paramecium pentaurelia]|uniref:Uncharacterized protein n=1 Tax=Paramecium pentaurelia TaxID=43138 RepID=A0A8S1ULS8_9CILI|nr:unnamed protein product [Paramecium pentaurelia]
MDSINERCTNSIKSNEEIEKLCTPEYNNFIDKAIYLLNNGQTFQKLFVCQNINKATEFDFYVPELVALIINKIKTEEPSVIKELIKALSNLIILLNENIVNKIKEQLLKQLQDLCSNYFNSPFCDQICELMLTLSKYMEFDFDSYLLILNEDSVRYEGLKIIEMRYSLMSNNQQALSLKHVKQCIGRKNERMCRIIDQVILKHDKLLMILIRDQDWLKNTISLISDFDKQVRINGCKLFLNSWLKMEEQGYEGHLKFQDTLQDIIQFIDDDPKIIILIVQCLSTIKTESIQQAFMDYIRPQPIQIELVKEYYQYIYLFDSKIRQQYDDFLINQVSNLIDTSKEFSFLKHLSDLYCQLNEQTHQQLLGLLFGNLELNQIFFIPYLLDIINKGNRIKNKQFTIQLQKTFDFLKKSILNYELKGLWYEVEETLNILECLANNLNIKPEFNSLCFSYLSMGSQHIRKKISIYLIDQITENYEKIVPQYLQYLNHTNYTYRILLIDFCIQICRKRSRNFFKQCNLIQVLQLQNDPVYIVRLKFVQLIYEMRLLFWNEEKELVIKLQQIFQQFLIDKKSIVQQMAKDINQKLQQIHFHHPETIIKQEHANNLKENMETFQPKHQIRLKTPTKNNTTARLQTPTNKVSSQTPTLKKQQILFPKPQTKSNCVQLPKVPPKSNITKNQQFQKNSKDY